MRRFGKLLSVLAAVLVAACALAFVPAFAQAQGAGGAIWKLVGAQTLTDVYPEDAQSIAKSRYNIGQTDDAATYSITGAYDDGRGGKESWTSTVSWSNPPASIPVGRENEAALPLTLALTNVNVAADTPDMLARGSLKFSNVPHTEAYVLCEWGSIDGEPLNFTPTYSQSILGDGSKVAIGRYQWENYRRLSGDVGLTSQYASGDTSDWYRVSSYTAIGQYANGLVTLNSAYDTTAALDMTASADALYTSQLLEGKSPDGMPHSAFGMVMYVYVRDANVLRAYFYEYDVGASNDVVIDTVAPPTSGESSGGTTSGGTSGTTSGGTTSGGTSGTTSGGTTAERDTDGNPIIPIAIVLGAIAAGAAVLSKRKNKPKGEQPSDAGPAKTQVQPERKPEAPSTFHMVLWKDFGDTLFVGGASQLVGARIEEVRADGTVVFRPDLTAQTTFAVSDNLHGEAIGMQGPYQALRVQATGPLAGPEGEGIVAMKFTGAGGSFTNNVHFKLRALAIEFADVPLTFVAGARQTFQMPFKLSDDSIAQGAAPRFAVRFTSADAEEYFRGARVVTDPDYPDKLFAVELTERGPVRDDDIPGTMQRFTCEVQALLPAAGGNGAAGAASRTITGSFDFFRFREGLRFTMEPLKCYFESYATREETLVDANEALGMAAQAQTAAMGLAGGLVSAVGAAATVREAARDLKERFPELYREEDVYLFDKRDKVLLTPGRTHAYLTLYVVDEFAGPDGTPYLRPVTPLVAKDDLQLAFADVAGSSVLHDEEGREIARPVDTLDFRYFIKKVQPTDNTVVLEILPTKGVMLPPNRAQADVAAIVRWKGRTFTATQRINAISQPYRIDFEEKCDSYIAADDEIRTMLYGIQHKIQGATGKLVVKGSVKLGETAADLVEGAIDNPLLAFNPITGPGLALYNLYTSTRRQVSANVYYDNLMPLYHYIEMMLEGHAYEFGFFDYDVRRVVTTFARFESGEIGSAEAIDLAYHGHDMMFADALSMTVRDWNHSWTAIGTRIGFALLTAGKSEWVFMPMASIGAGMEASMDYIDRGGDNLLEAYRVGVDKAGKHALFEGAVAGGVSVAAKCAKTAWILAKEGFAQRQLFAKALKETVSTAAYGQKVSAVATGLEGQLARAGAHADAAIHAFRGGAQTGEAIEREIAYTLGRLEGGYKLDALRDLVSGGGRSLNAFQQRGVIVAIQSDKHAMRALMEGTGAEADAMRSFFSRAMGQIEKDALRQAQANLSARLKIPMDKLRVKGTSGNAGKVSMDMDATFQCFDDATGKWTDVKAALGQEAFDAEFYKIVKGYAAESGEAAAAFARRADMTITDLFHPEAYSPEYADALRVIDASRAGEAFAHGAKVAQVAQYKCDHWLQLARKAAGEASAARATGKMLDAQRLAAASEAFAEESARQFTKQADRLIINKLAAMQAKGVAANTSVNIDLFLEKVAVLKRSGMGRFGGAGLTSGEVDAVLSGGYGTNLGVLYQELETLTLELDNAIKAAAK